MTPNSLIATRHKINKDIMSAPDSKTRKLYMDKLEIIEKRIKRLGIKAPAYKGRFPLPQGIEGKLLRLRYNTITVREVMKWLRSEWRLRCMERGRG